jgi:hypothetical protein
MTVRRIQRWCQNAHGKRLSGYRLLQGCVSELASLSEQQVVPQLTGDVGSASRWVGSWDTEMMPACTLSVSQRSDGCSWLAMWAWSRVGFRFAA